MVILINHGSLAPWLFASCWPDTALSFLPSRPLYMVACFIKASKEDSQYGKYASSVYIAISCNYGNDILSSLPYSVGSGK